MKRTTGKTKSRSSSPARATSSAHPRRATNHRSRAAARQTSTRKAPLSMQFLKDFLSQMLAVEKGGEQLYQKTLDELEHEELQDRLERFYEQTRRHVELCEEMIEAAAQSIDYMSPMAMLVEQKAQPLISAEAEEGMRDANNLESLVIAETKDHWNWESLSALMGDIEDRDLRQVVKRAVGEVTRQERDHVKWATDQLSKLSMAMAHQADEQEESSEEEEEGEEHSMH